jgi:hypothetical protein
MPLKLDKILAILERIGSISFGSAGVGEHKSIRSGKSLRKSGAPNRRKSNWRASSLDSLVRH